VNYVRDGDMVNFASEIEGNAAKFKDELNELLNQEIEVVFTKITLPDNLEVEPSILVALEKFINIGG
jgi:hypothetical protein